MKENQLTSACRYMAILSVLCCMFASAGTNIPTDGKSVRPDGGNETKHLEFVALAKKGGIDVLFVGDDVFAGWAGAGKMAWTKYFGEMRAAVFAVDGDQSANVLWRLRNGELEGLNPKVVVLNSGLNNALRGKPDPEAVFKDMAAAVETVRAKCKSARIILLGVAPYGVDDVAKVGRATLGLTANRLLATLHDGKQVHFVDLAMDGDGRIRNDVWRIPRSHFVEPAWVARTAAGYEVLTAGLAGAVKDALAGMPIPRRMTTPPFSAKLPSAKDPGARPKWLNEKSHEAFMELAKKGGINVLFVGDSITAGWHGGWGSKGSMEAWDRYFAPLGGAVFGIGGEHIGPLNWRLWNGELECRPKVVVLQAGANDLIRDAGGEDVAAGLLQIVANILEKSPKTKVLLIGPLPYGGGGDRKEFYSYSFQESWVVANKVLARTDFGGRPVKYLDVGNVFLDEEGNIDRKLMGDLLHPSADGYMKWAERIAGEITRLLRH